MGFKKIVNLILIGVGLLCLQGASVFGATTEYRTVHDTGLDANNVSIGHVTGFSRSALGVFESPVGHTQSNHETSLYYTTLMDSDVSLFAGATQVMVLDRVLLSVGVVQNTIDAGYETVSVNNTVSEAGALTYSSTEYVGNATLQVAQHSHIGVTGHYISRDQFGITGDGVGLSVGYRYETDRLGLSLGGRYLNSPKIAYSNGATEELYAQWYMAGKRRLSSMPVEAYAQLDFIPELSLLKKGVGVRTYLTELMSVSAGYMESRGIGSDLDGYLTAGASIHLGVLRVDYAYNSVDYAADTSQHRVMLSFLY